MEAMQLEISELCCQLRWLNWLLKKTNDGDDDDNDDEGGSEGRLTSFEKAIMKLGHKYGYMMNMFLQHSEFAPQQISMSMTWDIDLVHTYRKAISRADEMATRRMDGVIQNEHKNVHPSSKRAMPFTDRLY